MKFQEIPRRLTGFSCPIFGVSWNPGEAEVTTARRILAFLEDRRVLYSPYELELPAHCVHSIQSMRAFLTQELGMALPDELAANLRAMRAACRKFLNTMAALDARQQIDSQYFGGIDQWEFNAALGELRSSFGVHIAMIAAQNGLDVEDDLASIFPAEDDGDHDEWPIVHAFDQ